MMMQLWILVSSRSSGINYFSIVTMYHHTVTLVRVKAFVLQSIVILVLLPLYFNFNQLCNLL